MADEQKSRDERTEEATPRRREEARERGQVAMSQEFVAALMLCGSAAAFALGGGHIAEAAGRLTVGAAESAAELGTVELDPHLASGLVRSALATALPALAVTLLPAIAIGLLAGYGQAGFRFASKALEMKPEKLDPIKGFGRLLGVRGWVRLGLGSLKIVALAAAVVFGLWLQRGHIFSLAGQELGPVVLGGLLIVTRAIGGAVALFVAIALIDVSFQRFQHGRDLRMTKQEVKEDLKNTEGDPHIRARVRQIQREMASRRMLADVPKSTVVVTNPTHVAVALSYERDSEDGPPVAPRVVAKGLDHMAQRIKEIAREAGVPLHEDVPLARSLYKECRVGDHIPERLYAAVATVIGFVYRARERKKRAG